MITGGVDEEEKAQLRFQLLLGAVSVAKCVQCRIRIGMNGEQKWNSSSLRRVRISSG